MTQSAAWLYLLIAGILEVVWALGLKSTAGFTKPGPSLLVLAVMAAGFYCLAQSVKVLPISTAYAVWTGIGAAGTSVLGILLFGEPLPFYKALCLLLIISGTLGLKFLPS